MSRKRNFLTAGGTLCCALGIGYFMQSGTPVEHRPVVTRPAGLQQTVLAPTGMPVAPEQAAFDISDIKLTSSLPGLPIPKRPQQPSLESADHGKVPVMNLADPYEEQEQDCAIRANAAVVPMARVALSVDAPCYRNQRVTIHHSGLMFTDMTDGSGMFEVTVPALSEQAVFIVAFPDGTGTVTQARVDDLMDYERVALQWGGVEGLQIHAREFGADYGEQGHIWSSDEAEGQGLVERLGQPGADAVHLAEIYTFPKAGHEQAGVISLSIEAEVTAANCNHDITAQSLELRQDASLRTRDLTLSMPNCDATGDFLLLNNLVEDLKIAAK